MKFTSAFLFVFWGTILSITADTSAAPSIFVRQYPYAQLIPLNPAAGEDVSLFYVLGEKFNSCVPTYTTSIEKVDTQHIYCIMAPCPQHYIIHVSYNQNLVKPVDTTCLQAVTSYGPRYNFGKLGFGDYFVVNGTDTIAVFSVSENKIDYSIKGTVTENTSPLKNIKVLPGVKVYLYDQRAVPYASIIPSYTDSATTDQQGMYTFTVKAPGSYSLKFIKAGYQTYHCMVDMAKDTIVNVSLLISNAKTSIKGTVSTEQCPSDPRMGMPCVLKPVPGCTVTVAYQQYNPALLVDLIDIGTYKAITDSAGAYHFDSIPVNYIETAKIGIRKPGYIPKDSTIHMTKGIQITANFLLDTPYSNKGTTVVDGVRFTVSTDKSEYTRGQSINAKYTVVNTTMTAVSFNTGAAGCQTNMVVKGQKGDTLYWNMKDKACPAIMVTLTIKPGDSVVYYYPPFTTGTVKDTILSISAEMIGYPKSLAVVKTGLRSVSTRVEKKSALISTKEHAVYMESKQAIVLTLQKAQNVTIKAVVLNGRCVRDLSRTRFFNAGTHELSLAHQRLASGILYIDIKGERFHDVKRIDLSVVR